MRTTYLRSMFLVGLVVGAKLSMPPSVLADPQKKGEFGETVTMYEVVAKEKDGHLTSHGVYKDKDDAIKKRDELNAKVSDPSYATVKEGEVLKSGVDKPTRKVEEPKLPTVEKPGGGVGKVGRGTGGAKPPATLEENTRPKGDPIAKPGMKTVDPAAKQPESKGSKVDGKFGTVVIGGKKAGMAEIEARAKEAAAASKATTQGAINKGVTTQGAASTLSSYDITRQNAITAYNIAETQIRSDATKEIENIRDTAYKHIFVRSEQDRQIGRLISKNIATYMDQARFQNTEADTREAFELAYKRVEAVRDARIEQAKLDLWQKCLDAWTPALGEKYRQGLLDEKAEIEGKRSKLAESARDLQKRMQASFDKEQSVLGNIRKKLDAATTARSQGGSEGGEDEREKVRRALQSELYRLNGVR